MRSSTGKLRIGAWLATTSLFFGSLPLAWAQPLPPAGEEQAGEEGSDPPAIAGRLAAVTGAVSFHAAGESQWNAATLNYPVTNGEAFWTEPQAAATIEIADDRLVLDGSTELDINTLDQAQFSATEAQGALYLRLTSLPTGQSISFNTPRGTVQISAAGRYEIVAGDTSDATSITVVEGAAHVSGSNLSLDIGPQQTATISGADTLQGSVGPMQQDPFLRTQLAAEQQQSAPQLASTLPQRVRYMTGAAELQRYGSFQQTSEYGQVWYPRDEPRSWAPYRDGHWAYVQPWGWTWVDNARWGFAPFHYGRWVQVNSRWGWVAGEESAEAAGSPYPVYSPALVTFVDVGGAALAGAALGFAAGELAGGYAPAWIPLGPREPYYPWYHCRADYFGRINTPYGVPRTIIDRGPTYINNVTVNRTNVFINRGGATVVPAAAFTRGQSVLGIGRPLPERALAEARPVVGRLPIRPTAYTPGLTRQAAQRFNIPMQHAALRAAAPGPRIVPMAPGRAAPALRPATLPANVHVAPLQGRLIAQPGAPLPRPATPGPQIGQHGPAGLPMLRAPGTRPQAVPAGGATLPPRPEIAHGVLPGARGGEAGVNAARDGRAPAPGGVVQPVRASRAGGSGNPAAAALRAQAPRPTAQAPNPASRPEALRPQSRAVTPRADEPRPIPRPVSRPVSRTAEPRVQAPPPPAPRAGGVPHAAPRIEAPHAAPVQRPMAAPPPRPMSPARPPAASAPRPAPSPRPMPAPARPAPAQHPAPAKPEKH